jgi:hypothetical protein
MPVYLNIATENVHYRRMEVKFRSFLRRWVIISSPIDDGPGCSEKPVWTLERKVLRQGKERVSLTDHAPAMWKLWHSDVDGPEVGSDATHPLL